jgi:hypothetical protein
MANVVVQLLGIFFGVFARTSLPFFRKLYQGKIKSFKIKYFYQALGAFLLSVIFSLLIIPHLTLENKSITGDWLYGFKLFCLSFAFGFGFNSLINEAGEWLKNDKKGK